MNTKTTNPPKAKRASQDNWCTCGENMGGRPRWEGEHRKGCPAKQDKTAHTPAIERTMEDQLRFERDMARIQSSDLRKINADLLYALHRADAQLQIFEKGCVMTPTEAHKAVKAAIAKAEGNS